MEWYFLFVLALIAFLYASVGHGGASGYLAFMAIIGIEPFMMKSTALTLNIFVAGISFLSYYRNGYFKPKLLWPFAITSVPAAFIGAKIDINPEIYKIILGIFLLFAILRIFLKFKKTVPVSQLSILPALVIGTILGFFSGMIGIGGGIILTPVLILLGWANIKEAAAVSAPFILLNSVSGILGLFSKGFQVVPEFWIWVVVALAGGLLGAQIGSKKLSTLKLHYILAIVLGTAAIKLIIF